MQVLNSDIFQISTIPWHLKETFTKENPKDFDNSLLKTSNPVT
jgi:hypothetical protein